MTKKTDCLTTFTQEHKCPYCEHPIDAISGSHEPQEGDISLCGYCGGLLVVHLDSSVPVTPITDEEMLALEPEQLQMLKRMQEQLKELNLKLKEESDARTDDGNAD
jgi:hypothetical protein